MRVVYLLLDVDKLRRHQATKDRRRNEWNVFLEQERITLAEEQNVYDDILMLEGVVDVYRSLPLKLLLCHRWSVEPTSFSESI